MPDCMLRTENPVLLLLTTELYTQPTVKSAELAAASFFSSAEVSLELFLDKEKVPLERAFQAVCEALLEECTFRVAKVADLTGRLEDSSFGQTSTSGKVQRLDTKTHDDTRSHRPTPRKLRVSGLRGDSEDSNGVYCVDGLRCFWGRPLYTRMPENAGDTTPPRYMFYGMTHEAGEMQPDGTESKAKWVDGVWVLGSDLHQTR